MLPKPCALKSPSVFEGDPSGLGTASETPAPWTSTMTAITTAPVRTLAEKNRRRGGRSGTGIPVGISPRSATVATAGRATAASTVGMASAMTDA